MNALTKVKHAIQDVFEVDFDQRTSNHIAVRSNKLRGIAVIAKVATDEITDTFICGEYQVAQALVAKRAIEDHLEAYGVSPEEYKLILGMQTHTYLKNVARVLQDGAEAITEEAAHSYR